MKIIKKYLPFIIGFGVILLISSCHRKGSGCPSEITSVDPETFTSSIIAFFA